MPNYIYYRTQLPSLFLLNNSVHWGNNCSFSHGLTGHMLARISGRPLQTMMYFCAFWVWSEHNLSIALAVILSTSNATALGGFPSRGFCDVPSPPYIWWKGDRQRKRSQLVKHTFSEKLNPFSILEITWWHFITHYNRIKLQHGTCGHGLWQYTDN